MESKISTPIDIVGLRERLSKLTYDNLKIEATTLGVAEVWKNGVNKQTAVETIIKAVVAKSVVTEPVGSIVVEKPEPVTETPVSEEVDQSLEEQIPVGEYDIDQDTLDEFPGLSVLGFNVGDILVHEEGKLVYKKSEEETIKGIPISKINEELANLNGGVPHDTIKPKVEKPVERIEVENVKGESGEYVPEEIDESKFTEEELEENISICHANCRQAIPQTRIFLLRKIDALELALERKRK